MTDTGEAVWGSRRDFDEKDEYEELLAAARERERKEHGAEVLSRRAILPGVFGLHKPRVTGIRFVLIGLPLLNQLPCGGQSPVTDTSGEVQRWRRKLTARFAGTLCVSLA